MYKALSSYTFKKTIKNSVAEWYTNKLDTSERIHVMEVSGNRGKEKIPKLDHRSHVNLCSNRVLFSNPWPF